MSDKEENGKGITKRKLRRRLCKKGCKDRVIQVNNDETVTKPCESKVKFLYNTHLCHKKEDSDGSKSSRNSRPSELPSKKVVKSEMSPLVMENNRIEDEDASGTGQRKTSDKTEGATNKIGEISNLIFNFASSFVPPPVEVVTKEKVPLDFLSHVLGFNVHSSCKQLKTRECTSSFTTESISSSTNSNLKRTSETAVKPLGDMKKPKKEIAAVVQGSSAFEKDSLQLASTSEQGCTAILNPLTADISPSTSSENCISKQFADDLRYLRHQHRDTILPRLVNLVAALVRNDHPLDNYLLAPRVPDKDPNLLSESTQSELASDPGESSVSTKDREYDALITQDADGDTPLHIMVAKQDTSSCRTLMSHLDKKAINIKNVLNQTPLHIAAYLGDTPIITNLIDSGATIATVDCDGNTPLHLIIDKGDDMQIKAFLNAKLSYDDLKEAMEVVNFKGDAAIHIAIRSKKENAAKRLIEAGCNIDIKDFKGGMTPLHIALEMDMFDLSRYLIRMGASVNIQSYNDNLPLHLASQKEQLDIINLLIDNGSQVSVKNIDCCNPKDLARSSKIKAVLDKEMVRVRRKRQARK